MKKLLLALFALNYACFSAHAQSGRYVDVNYRLTRDAIAYASLADTALKIKEPEVFRKGNVIVVRSWPTPRWAECVSAGDHYFVRATGLRLEGKPPAYLQRDGPTISDQVAPIYAPSDSRTIHTGPRGGRYYINSNGNKTYIRRK